MKPAWKPIKVKLGQIRAWDKNPRISTKAQAQRIIASERKFGQPVPFLISPDFLLYDGHQRLAAWFTVYGADYEMDAMQSDRPLSEDEHKELVITLHTGATGSWNWDALSGWSAGDLQEWGMNGDALKGWNNDANNLKELLNADNVEPVDAEPQIDRAAELAEKWNTATGQLWKLGEHRLLIGDCTVRENVVRLMGGEKAELLFTSPPYADMREYEGGDMTTEYLASFIPAWNDFCNYQVVNLGIKRENDEVKEYWNDYINAARNCGLKLLCWNVWDKMLAGSIANQSAMFAIEHEWIFVFGKQAKQINRTVLKSPDSEKRLAYNRKDTSGRTIRAVRQADGTMKDSVKGENYEHKNMPSVIQVFPEMARDSTGSHPAVFPLSLVSVHIETMTKQGEAISEPFAGSGTTIIAAHNLNRRCFACEISPKYGAVILERFFTATGITPELVE